MWTFWLITAGIFFVIEIFTVGFLVFWFGIGALFAMIASFFTSNIIIQTTVFIISSSLLILITKPFVKKFVDVKSTKTNAFSIIGKKALVTKDINPHTAGQIKIQGELWTAETNTNENISKGTEVEILEIKGVKAIVKPL